MKRNEAINQAIKAISMVINGGKGSGNFGHAGRPGKVGGAGEGGASDSSTSSPSSKDLMPKRGSYSDLPTIKRTYTDSVTGAQREEVLYRPVFDLKTFKEIKTGDIKDGKYTPSGSPEAIYNEHFGK